MSDERGLNEQQGKDWVKKLRYSRSFLSKLVLSDISVKEYYAAIATKLLSYEKIKSRFNWSGVNFSFGRTTVAKVAFSGKTLCVYLAVAPDESLGRYKATDVGNKKAYRFTPSKLKIKSSGALRAAVFLIEKMAGELSLTEKSPLPEPILAKNFPSDTFDNLLTRGLIRRIVEVPKTIFTKTDADGVAEIPVSPDSENIAEIPEGLKFFVVPEDVYKDTVKTAKDLISRHDEYTEILDVLKSGELAVNLSKKFMLKMIDETWVKAVEDSIPALDEVVRTPSHFIEETEEVLPIERTKKVTSRSLIHLSQHTDLISRIDSDNTITPSKLLNVFRDDSIMTYENKFVNTLLNRLLTFVTVRYNAAVKNGANEKVTAMDFTDTFVHGAVKGKIRLEIEVTDTIDNKDKVKNYAVNTDLWKRVRKLYEIVRNYQSSELVLNMGKTFVRPPIMRTNPILKNKNLRQCLALWEFIESYDDEIGIIVDEKKEEVSEELLKQVYNGVAQQYLVFCRNVAAIRTEENDFVVPRELTPDASETAKVRPVFDYTHSSLNENEEEPENEDELLFAVEVALAADSVIEQDLKEKERKAEEEKRKARELEEQREREELERRAKQEKERQEAEIRANEEEKEGDETEDDEVAEYLSEKDGVVTKTLIRYKKSFAAKLSLASDTLKEYYSAIRNKLLTRDKVKLRTSFACDTFYSGRKTLAKVTIVGKSLRVYFALSPAEIPPKYFVKDVSEIKKYADTPAMMKVKSDRALKNALTLTDTLCSEFTDAKVKPNGVSAKDFPRHSIDKLVAMGLVKKIITTVTVSETEKPAANAAEKVSLRPAPLPFKSIKPDTEEDAAEVPAEKLSEKDLKRIKENARKQVEEFKKSAENKESSEDTPLKTTEVSEDTEIAEVSDVLEDTEPADNAPADMSGAGGDPLLLKKDVVESISETILELPDEEPAAETPAAENASAAQEEVPVGGDALTLKPITLADLEKSAKPETEDAKEEQEEQEEEFLPKEDATERKQNLFSRIFRRKK